MTVSDWMTRDPRSVAPDAGLMVVRSLAEAARVTIDAEASSLLVVNGDGALAGILTARDVLGAMAGR